jgi:nucleotide-binding universal stress UspA family protein
LSACPVRRAMIGKVVIGLDGSAGSAAALDWVIANVGKGDAEVVAVHAIRPLGEFLLDLPGTGLDDWRKSLQWELEARWCAPLRGAGVAYRAVTVDRTPALALAEVAEAEEADVIVVGTQGHGGVADRVLGSVSYKLAHTAHRPVLIVPPAP